MIQESRCHSYQGQELLFSKTLGMALGVTQPPI